MKYEYLCGHVSDFLAMPENIIAVVQLDHCVQGLTEFSQITECGKPVLAMRRIIAEPKRWTVADQKAGLLPDVGAKVDGGKVVFVNGFNVVTELKRGAVIVSSSKTFLNTFKPIETPEEKAARLCNEWCKTAADIFVRHPSCSATESLGGIYKAMLSGDLPVPVKDGE